MLVRKTMLLCVAVVALVGAPAARGQSPASGAVAGRITIGSAEGEPAHGATVLIVGLRQFTTTDSEGRFVVTGVPPGPWEVLAERQHFSTARASVTVAANQTVTVELVLELAGVHEELTVTASATGARTTFDGFNAVTSLDSDALARARGATIADALSGQPGIALRSFGPGSARPIIRGFDGDRVLVMQDGVRTGDLSSQSGDHGITLDPASLERLEVVKGPATLLYGSNAIGGVVNAVTPEETFRAAPFSGQIGTVTVDAGSANTQAGAGAFYQYGNGRWTMWAGGGARRTGDYDTPLGPVGNSATQLSTGRFGIGWNGARPFFTLAGQFEDGRHGIPFAGEFHAHEEEDGEGDDESAEEQVDIASRRLDLRVDTGLRSVQNAFMETFKVTLAYTDYGHDELEIAGAVETPGTRFDNDTVTLRAELEQKRVGRWGGRIGAEWFGRDFRATGEEALAPPTSQSSLAAFIYEEVDFGRVRLQLGARVEKNDYDTMPREESADNLPDAHDEHGDEPEPPAVRDRDFTGGSGSFGVHADLGSGNALVANFSAASRAPALEELYNFGPHVGNLAFEIGNPDLDLERTLGVDASLRTRTSRLRSEINVFLYEIDNFVFLDFTGNEVDGLREAVFLQGDSRFTGFEASASVDLSRGLHLHGGLSYVSARLRTTDEALPRIPPLSGRVALEIPWGAWSFRPEVTFAGRQDEVFRDETPTVGSVRLNVGLSYLVLHGHTTHAVSITAYNLTNETYRSHTSFIKDLAPEMGRGIRAAYTLRFF